MEGIIHFSLYLSLLVRIAETPDQKALQIKFQSEAAPPLAVPIPAVNRREFEPAAHVLV